MKIYEEPEIQKLMYFMQVAGEELKLTYGKAQYGPYCTEIRHVLNHTEGHLTSGYADGGDDPTKQIELVPGAVDDAKRFLRGQPETLARFDRVAALTEGFESPYGLELLATVHWVIRQEHAVSEEDILRQVHAWSLRTRQFTPRQITIATQALRSQNWVR